MHAATGIYARPEVSGRMPKGPAQLQIIPWVERKPGDMLKRKEGSEKVRGGGGLAERAWRAGVGGGRGVGVAVAVIGARSSAGKGLGRRQHAVLWRQCVPSGREALPLKPCPNPNARAQMKRVYFIGVKSAAPYQLALDQVKP